MSSSVREKLSLRATKRGRGDFPTPPDLAREVVNYLRKRHSLHPALVFEPTCGEGNLMAAALSLNAGQYLGVELNKDYCRRARERFQGERRVTIVEGDIFAFPLTDVPREGLLILGNPPWVQSSTLGVIGEINPVKRVHQGTLPALAALTGEGNFDLSAELCFRLIKEFKNAPVTLCLLLKSAVARRVVEYLRERQVRASVEILNFDAQAHFKVHTTGTLLYIRLSASLPVPAYCEVRSLKEDWPLVENLSFSDEGRLCRNSPRFAGKSELTWRQGLKHDCARVLILEKEGGHFVNGLGERVAIERERLYPFLKGAQSRENVRTSFSHYLILTQSRKGQDTLCLKETAPLTFAYLTAHAPLLEARKSAVYAGQPPFALFGVGPYTFAPYKVVIGSFYPQPRFCLTYSYDGKAVIPDDTCYAIGFEDEPLAYTLMLALNTGRAREALRERCFEGSKRPYTKRLLMGFSLLRLCESLSPEELSDCETSAHLKRRVSPAMLMALRAYLEERVIQGA